MKILILIAICLLQTSCYTFSASSLPKHLKTIQIYDIDNRSSDPVLANTLKQRFRDMFKKNASSVQLVNNDANADFKVILKSYSNRVDNYSRDAQVQLYRVRISISMIFKDNVEDRIIYQNNNMVGEGTYDISINESEQNQGQTRAIQALIDLTVNNALSDW